jgi:ArsR family transcriptional regulator, arsenate/arsenite/antimonite-responsive transcriptional repressor
MDISRLSKIMKALSNKNRLEIFLKIAKGHQGGGKSGSGYPISDISRSLNIGAPTVSHHLKELSNAGLITTEKRGRRLMARIIKKTMADVRKVLNVDPDTRSGPYDPESK